LLVEVPVDQSTTRKQSLFQFLLPVDSLGLLVIVDYGVDGLFEVSRLLLRSEQLDSDASSQRVEVFVKKQLFHLFVNDGQLILEDSSQNELIILIFYIVLPFVQNFVQASLEVPINLLGSHR
jgi:hypothetical protein